MNFFREAILDGTLVGCSCVLEPERHSHVIVGSEGKISFSVFDNPVITLTKKGKEEVIRFDALAHVQQPMIAQVVAYFLNEAPNPCSAQEGLAVMQLLDTFTAKK